jgi:exportin-7
MNAEQLVELEGWCEALYGNSDPARLAEAQRRLVPLGESAEYIPQCQFIMEHSRNSYALLVGAQSLTRLITTHWNSFTVSQRVDIRV